MARRGSLSRDPYVAADSPDDDLVLRAMRDPEFLKAVGGGSMDAVNRGGVATALGWPVDTINSAINLGKAGYGTAGRALGLLKNDEMPELEHKPVGGSEWIGDRMHDWGMVSDQRNPTAEMFGGLAFGGAASKAPQAARAVDRATGQMLENMRAPGEAGYAAAQRGAVPLKAKPAAEPVVELPPEEAALAERERVLENFGNKKADEKRRAALLKKQQAEAEAGKVIEKQTGKGTRAKVDPRVYRQMYEDQGRDAVIAAAEAGEHLKPQPGGGWVGLPRTVLTRRHLNEMRNAQDTALGESTEMIRAADEPRLGTWYPRAKAYQADTMEPWQLDRGLEGHATYSAGVAPENELGFALKDWNQRQLGGDQIAYRKAGAETLASAIRESRPAKLAAKVGEYRNKNDPRMGPIEGEPAGASGGDPDNPFGVNDFRAAQGWWYTDPKGNPWKAGVRNEMHPVMDAETAMLGDRARQGQFGGLSNWNGEMTQEIPWVRGKAEDFYGRGTGKTGQYNAKLFGDDPTQAMLQALRDANNTGADYLPKHAASATYEYTPGASTGHRPDMLGASMEDQQAYARAGGRWDRPANDVPIGPNGEPAPHWDSPYGDQMPERVGRDPRDAIYSALGLRQQGTLEGVGQYTNMGGGVEQNLQGIARPLVDFKTTAKGDNANTIHPDTLASMRAAEIYRGVSDAQEAVAMNLPGTGTRKGKTSVLLEHDRRPTAQELHDVSSLLPGSGYEVSPTSRGMALINTEEDSPETAMRFARAMREPLELGFPGSKFTPSAHQGIYEPAIGKWGEKGIEPTTPGSGEATGQMLQAFADAPPQAARNMSESPELRELQRMRLRRDIGPGNREDIQRTRGFLAEADWAKVVDLIRQGMKPAAAMAALGYSLEGMAAGHE